ncbi:MAG: hypothetical protein CMN34_02005 [Saprospirales bacterium]|nr:hypothetical protein [Saprospirales bacterium]
MRHNYVKHFFIAALFLLVVIPSCKDGESQSEKVINSQSSLQNANQLIPSKNALVYFYTDIQTLSDAMDLDKPSQWQELAPIQELLYMNSNDSVIQPLIDHFFSQGIQDGKIMGSLGITTNLMQLYNGLQSERTSAEEWQELLSFDMALVSTSVPLLINAIEAEGTLEDVSSIPVNQYGFKTHTIEEITIGWCDTILLISNNRATQLGKPHKENIGNFTHQKELLKHDASILIDMPSSLSKSLVRAIPLAAKSAPNVEITNGLERLLIDFTEAYDYQLYSINVENNNVHLAMEVAMDPTTKLAQILYQSCDEKETSNMPLRKVSPTDNKLLFGFGYSCLDFIEVLDKEYDYFNSLHALQENIQEAPNNDPMAAMIDFPREDIIQFYGDLSGEYSFSYQQDSVKGMHLSLFLGMDTVLSEDLQQKLDGILSFMTLFGILPPESTAINYADDGIYLVLGEYADDIQRFKQGEWPEFDYTSKEDRIGYGEIDIITLAKSVGFSEDFSNIESFDQLLGNLQLELLMNPTKAQATAAMKWTINRDKTNADQGILWVLLSPLFD